MAGVVTGLISNPMDVVKTRLMDLQKPGASPRNVLQSFGTIVSTEGIRGVYKGCMTTILRQCMFTLGTFLVLEQMRKIF